MYKCLNGRSVTLTCIDTAQGFIHGYIDGINKSDPVTWGWPDGNCLNFHPALNPQGYNLDMKGFKCQQ